MISLKKRSAYTLLCLLIGSMSLSGQTILQSWSFADGTDLESTSNAGSGTATWTSPPVGTLEIDIARQSYRSFGDIQGTQAIGTFGRPYTASDAPVGIIRFEAVVSGWDMSAFEGTNTLRGFSVAIQDSSNSQVGRFLVQYIDDQVRFRFQTNIPATENLFVGTPAGNDLDLVNTDTPYTLRVEVDFDNGTITHFLNGEEVGSITESTPGSLATLDINRIVFNNFGPGSFDQAGATVNWDSLTLTALNQLPDTRVQQLSGDLAFGNLDPGESDTREFTIRNSGYTALNVSNIELPEGYSVDWTGGSIGSFEEQVVTVTFSPPAGGNYDGLITVVSDLTSGDESIAVTGSATEALPDINFGETESLGDGWFQSSWLGVYNDTHMIERSHGWIFHADLGWWWLQAVPSGEGDLLYAFDFELGWVFLHIDLFPFFYSYAIGWVFYNQETNEVIVLE